MKLPKKTHGLSIVSKEYKSKTKTLNPVFPISTVFDAWPANVKRYARVELVGRRLALDHAELTNVITMIRCKNKVRIVNQG